MRLLSTCGATVLLALSLGSLACADGNDGSEPAFEQIGMASWYGAQFAGRPTASGTIFDQWGLTAAHRKLPLGAEVTVTNLENGKSVTVVVDDRGPYVKGRIIDLSRGAARKLGMVAQGVVRVRVEATEQQLAMADADVAGN